MTLEVIRIGPLATIQDKGRFGFRAFGVSPAGPMDMGAFLLANALIGNEAGAAMVEFAGMGGEFLAQNALRCAVTGGDVRVEVDGRLVEPCTGFRVEPGGRVKIGALKDAQWGYLAVSGGIATPPVLGSRSTHLRFGLGGVDGRALREGDILPVGPQSDGPLLAYSREKPKEGEVTIRVIPGPQEDYFSDEVRAAFFSTPFTVSPRFDRMAMMLEGPLLPAEGGHDIISDATVPGSIQAPGSGKPLVLMAEGQTTGGYPKIATIIGADLPRLRQLRPGQSFRFEAVSVEEAEEAWRLSVKADRERLSKLKPAGPWMPGSERLLSLNLISGVWGG